MTTRQEFREEYLREALSDTVAWPDATLNLWIEQAVIDYSQYFPFETYGQQDINSVTRQFSGEGGWAGSGTVLGVTRVEYPADQDPPRYLLFKPETSEDFLDGPYYDIKENWQIVIGETPTIGEVIRVRYITHHLRPALDGTTLSVPNAHLEALRLFVIWQAAKELELNEAANPDRTSIYLSLIGTSAMRAERTYKAKIRELQAIPGKGVYGGPWVMDGFDRVY